MTQIAAVMDRLGGQMNAFTEREVVCYHVKVLDDHLPLALEVLCDLVACPILAEDALELERGVVLEEIKSVEDEPEELVSDLFSETLYPNSRWGRPILGTAESVSRLQTSDLRRFRDTHYTPRDVLVTAAGNVRHEQVVQLSQKLLASLPKRNRVLERVFLTRHRLRRTRCN
jgi:predicted Zn-dependent peptidase